MSIAVPPLFADITASAKSVNIKLNMVRTQNFIKAVTMGISLISLTAVMVLIGSKTTFFNRAYSNMTGKNADITMDLSDTGNSYSPDWLNYSQGGESTDVMLSTAVDKMRELSPQYIRIDHVFDHYIAVGKEPDGSLTFDYAKLDAEIKNIKAMGARPFISVSYMPPVISGRSEIDLPQNWNDWSIIVQRLIEHISGKSSLAISGVYYEIWNEPDLMGSFKLSGAKNYLDLYKFAAIGAGSAQNVLPYKIGGPATTSLYKNWFDTFFKFADSNNLRVDFFSWHRYSKDTEVISRDVADLRTWIGSYPRYANTLFVLSEFGPNSETDPVYDSETGAYHLLSVFTLSEKPDLAFLFEVKDGKGPEKFWGRWGLMTNEAFGPPEVKPRFNAVRFAHKLKGMTVKVNGSGSWVRGFATYDEDLGVIRLLLTNYDQFGTHSESFPVEIRSIPFGQATVSKTYFSGPGNRIVMNLENGTYTDSIFLKPNSALLLEISPVKK